MGESSNFAQPSIPKFDGDYDHWSLLMENLLRSKEYFGVVQKGVTEPTSEETLSEVEKKALAEARLKDLKAKNYLFSAIDKSILKTITLKDTSKQLWDSMKTKYQGNSRVKRAQLQTLRRNFELLEMKNGETISDYFSRVMVVANDMRNCGDDMQDVKIVEKILRTLSESFNYIVCSIEESKDIDNLSVDSLQSSLLVHEQKMKKTNKGVEDHVLNVSYGDRNGRGRGRGTGQGRGRGRSFNKATVECFKCHKLGHFQYECPNWNGRANFAETEGEEHEPDVLLMASIEENGGKEEAWYFDSGCSNHMCGNKSWFSNLDEGFRHTVKLGNNSPLTVTGKGSVNLRVDGRLHIITDVYFVPDLASNLISVGQLLEKGCEFLIKQGECKVYHSELGLILQMKMTTNKLFKIMATKNGMNLASECLQTTATNELQLWHRRYGHLNYKGLKMLQQQNMVRGLPQMKTSEEAEKCVSCLVGKQHRESIPKKSVWRSSRRLQLIHSDLCGPISPASTSDKRYILTFIDDYSRKVWVYFLSNKSETFVLFTKFKNQMERETGESLVCLRTDRGGEYMSNEFIQFCEEAGISRQLTTAFTPQQNGVAERKNRTIMEMVRSILNEKEVPQRFWPEAVIWAVHVLNRSPTSVLKEKTPEEMWSGVKPTVDYFRVFGCLAHVHVPDQKRKKLDDKSIMCVLIGVSKESKGYRLYNPATEKVVTSRDVVFEEEKGWNWEKKGLEINDEKLVWDDCESYMEQNEDGTVQILEEENLVEENTERRPEETVSNSQSQIPRIFPEIPRIRRPPTYLKDYETREEEEEEEEEEEDTVNFLMFAAIADPLTFKEANEEEKWIKAMNAELESIEKNGTWFLMELPKGAKKIGVKWVYKTKLNEKGEVDKYKARLVAKGYAQREGVDYNEVFAPVARWDTIRMILALAAQEDWCVYQLDVKSAFLHGELSEDVYVEQPEGYVKKGEEQKVYKLIKALYGLKQAPRAWYSRIEAYFAKEGFQRCEYEHTLFVKTGEGNKILIVSLYVDDLIFTGNDEEMLAKFKSSMMEEFDMTDLGRMKYFLGVEVIQDAEGIFIHQKKYAGEILERFNLQCGNEVKNPMVPGTRLSKGGDGNKVDPTLYKQLIGSLMYITSTRPDLMYVVCLLSRYMADPYDQHLQAAKRVLRYIKGTLGFGVFYKRGVVGDLTVYTDSDYAGDIDDRRSTSGYAFLLGGGAVAWASKKQPVVTLSTTEAEFVAAAYCACQCVWMRRILEEFGLEQSGSTTIMCDNSSAIKLSKNPVLHGRSKHIDVRFHFLRDLTKDGVVKLVHCGTNEQVADILTKPLRLEVFVRLREKLGVCNRIN
ncbi:GAG-pre-integrase domain [Arabidopsis thaliana x Arabidopsis arenosa]|uniref:GAG-pre-integrase domain n=1 Tax=Arabidopsis thaliana x Arabidopsis arenosa TaxID=1240361 RepID=A0A8T1YDT0_9BRAS|nr:GAG-pre-integrase domain [Arabidopsis thaliana x Arabidopsis arenosa]